VIHRCGWWTAAVLLVTAGPRARAASTLQIVTDSLPAATVGTAYSQQIATTGGSCLATGTASNTIDTGALPPGLSVTSPAGVESWTIQGVPTAAGSFQFALHIRWFHPGVSPFNPDCTDDAVKTLTLTVQTGQGPQAPLTVDRSQISATYHIATFPPSSTAVQVTSGGTPGVAFTAQASTASGGSWLSVTPVSAVTPASLSISIVPSGLNAGVYSGTVTLVAGSGSPVVIGVSLTVVADTSLVLNVSPPSLKFSYITGGATPPAQTFTVMAAGNSYIFQADVNAPPTGKWLTLSPSGAATPATLTATVDPKGLSPATYNGTISLHLAGLTTIAQSIPVSFTVQSPAVLPTITSNGVVNAANLIGAIAPGAWVSIFGTNLAATTRPWATADFVASKLPTALDGVSVTIDGKAAPVSYISPTQINVLAPDDANTGLVFVQVTAPAGTSGTALALQQTAAPAFFQFRAPAAVYVAGTHADGSYLAGAALVQQGTAGTPAKPGETIVVYGTGFGATQPAISATALVTSPLPLANLQDLRIRIAGVDSAIAFAGLISPGLYQFNVVVPQVPDGDQTIVAELRGLLTRADLMVSVQH